MIIVYGTLIILGLMCAVAITAVVCAVGYWIFQNLMEDAEKARAKRDRARASKTST